MDGKLVRSCVTKMSRVADGASVTTIEGIGTPAGLHPLQLAWIAHGCAQCGFCSPGLVMTVLAMARELEDPGPDDICGRGNLATLDSEGRVTDRRAGRIDTETAARLAGRRISGAVRS